MSNPIFPGSLPQTPLQRGFSAERQDNKLSFAVEVGDEKVRRRYTGTLKTFSASFDCDPTQRAAFDTFHDVTLADGVLAFDWTDPVTGDAATFRFVSPPKWTNVGVTWTATTSLKRIA